MYQFDNNKNLQNFEITRDLVHLAKGDDETIRTHYILTQKDLILEEVIRESKTIIRNLQKNNQQLNKKLQQYQKIIEEFLIVQSLVENYKVEKQSIEHNYQSLAKRFLIQQNQRRRLQDQNKKLKIYCLKLQQQIGSMLQKSILQRQSNLLEESAIFTIPAHTSNYQKIQFQKISQFENQLEEGITQKLSKETNDLVFSNLNLIQRLRDLEQASHKMLYGIQLSINRSIEQILDTRKIEKGNIKSFEFNNSFCQDDCKMLLNYLVSVFKYIQQHSKNLQKSTKVFLNTKNQLSQMQEIGNLKTYPEDYKIRIANLSLRHLFRKYLIFEDPEYLIEIKSLIELKIELQN